MLVTRQLGGERGWLFFRWFGVDRGCGRLDSRVSANLLHSRRTSVVLGLRAVRRLRRVLCHRVVLVRRLLVPRISRLRLRLWWRDHWRGLLRSRLLAEAQEEGNGEYCQSSECSNNNASNGTPTDPALTRGLGWSIVGGGGGGANCGTA